MDFEVVRCDNCKQLAHSSEIKLLPQGLDTMKRVCKKCYEEFKKQPPKIEAKEVVKDPYFCKRCKYNFKHAPHSKMRLYCPGCGKSDELKKAEEMDY